jgi:hypothetical protein
MEKYYLITYVWKNRGANNWEYSNDQHKGTIAQWVLDMSEEPEHYVFISAVEITEEDYNKLDGVVG